MKIEDSPNNTNVYPFSKGANITVCVVVKPEAYKDGFEIKKLRRFDWFRYYEWFRYDRTDDDDETDDDDDWFTDDDWSMNKVQQFAIQYGTSYDELTDYWQDDCMGEGWCSFTTTLYADFYRNTGQVVGHGVATVGYRDNQVNVTEESQSQELSTTDAFFNISVDVKPKKRWQVPGIYTWFCDPTSMEGFYASFRPLPKEIPFWCDFRVGDLVTVCIAVEDEAYYDGVVIANVTDFHWKDDYWGGKTIQEGIRNGNVSKNTLPSFRQEDCNGKDWCSFSSTLSHKFFEETDHVYGIGNVSLKYQDESIEERNVNFRLRSNFIAVAQVQSPQDLEAYVSSTWVTTTLQYCSDYKPGYDERDFVKYISNTCTSQAQAYVQCRAMDTDCAHSMCPDVDAETITDTFPLELARIFTLARAYEPITSPSFCFELKSLVCYSDSVAYACCCQEEFAEWRECLITKDFPDMVEYDYPEMIGNVPICTVECERSASTVPEETSSSEPNIGVGTVVAIVLVGMFVSYLCFKCRRIDKPKDREEKNGESNEAQGHEQLWNSDSKSDTKVTDDSKASILE
jgi:hypothetical protein